jgi:unconventional SNARE in the endoplasmic reticulum protein 1
VHLENEKPITESGDEISYEGAKAKSLISLLSGLRRRSTLVQFGPFYLFSFLMVWSQQMELNRAHAKFGPSHHERKESIGAPIKLDVESHAHIQKHRFVNL